MWQSSPLKNSLCCLKVHPWDINPLFLVGTIWSSDAISPLSCLSCRQNIPTSLTDTYRTDFQTLHHLENPPLDLPICYCFELLCPIYSGWGLTRTEILFFLKAGLGYCMNITNLCSKSVWSLIQNVFLLHLALVNKPWVCYKKQCRFDKPNFWSSAVNKYAVKGRINILPSL